MIDGVGLQWEQTGHAGPRLVLIHGAWVDRHNWDEFVPHVAHEFQVLAYDRRGHGESDRPDFQGRMQDDVDELAGLLTQLNFVPAHLVGNSYGGMIALRMAIDHPEMCSSVTAHEPPFPHLDPRVMADPSIADMDRIQREIATHLAQGVTDSSISSFMDAVLAPGVWNEFPEGFRAYLRASAPSFVDDVNDPDPWSVDLDLVQRFQGEILLTQGALSPAWYRVIIDEIAETVPSVYRMTVANACHGAHVDQPAESRQDDLRSDRRASLLVPHLRGAGRKAPAAPRSRPARCEGGADRSPPHPLESGHGARRLIRSNSTTSWDRSGCGSNERCRAYSTAS